MSPVTRLRGALGTAHRAARTAPPRIRELVGGDRPLLAGLLTVLVVAVVMLSGPLENYLAARERVETLEAQAEALGAANRQLRQQVGDLRDPEHIELLAREEHGMVRPGQVAYVIIPPQSDRPRIADPVAPERVERSLLERVWGRLRDLVR